MSFLLSKTSDLSCWFQPFIFQGPIPLMGFVETGGTCCLQVIFTCWSVDSVWSFSMFSGKARELKK